MIDVELELMLECIEVQRDRGCEMKSCVVVRDSVNALELKRRQEEEVGGGGFCSNNIRCKA